MKKIDVEITAVDAARKLQVGLDYVYRLVLTGKLAGRKDGRQWRISLAAVEARIKARG